MLLPILFMFLNGIAAQESQTEPGDQKLDRRLAGQELKETALSQLRDIVAKIEAANQTSSQTGKRYLGSAISKTDHTGSNWIQ